jgi:hypothetical protein
MPAPLFNNRYRIPSVRLKNWNYANEGMYYITICTKNRIKYFGEIEKKIFPINNPSSTNNSLPIQVILSPTQIGQIAPCRMA